MKSKKDEENFKAYNEVTVLLTCLNMMLFMLDKYAFRKFYKHKIAVAGNLLKKAIQHAYTGIFTRVSINGIEKYAEITEYLMVQSSIYTSIKTLPEEKGFAFFNDLEDLYIKHGLLTQKGELLQSEADLEKTFEKLAS